MFLLGFDLLFVFVDASVRNVVKATLKSNASLDKLANGVFVAFLDSAFVLVPIFAREWCFPLDPKLGRLDLRGRTLGNQCSQVLLGRFPTFIRTQGPISRHHLLRALAEMSRVIRPNARVAVR